jgi:hypothetical protein
MEAGFPSMHPLSGQNTATAEFKAMPAFRNTALVTSGRLIRLGFILTGLALIGFALAFYIEMPETMPGPAMGALALLALGTILILGAIWIGT